MWIVSPSLTETTGAYHVRALAALGSIRAQTHRKMI
jgi:hypothetical protein